MGIDEGLLLLFTIIMIYTSDVMKKVYLYLFIIPN